MTKEEILNQIKMLENQLNDVEEKDWKQNITTSIDNLNKQIVELREIVSKPATPETPDKLKL